MVVSKRDNAMFQAKHKAHLGQATQQMNCLKDDPGTRPGCWALKMQAAQATGNGRRAFSSQSLDRGCLRALSGLASETGRVESFFKRLFS